MENTPIPAEPDNVDPGVPAPVELPRPVGQQAAVEEDEDERDRRADAVRRITNDPRTSEPRVR